MFRYQGNVHVTPRVSWKIFFLSRPRYVSVTREIILAKLVLEKIVITVYNYLGFSSYENYCVSFIN